MRVKKVINGRRPGAIKNRSGVFTHTEDNLPFLLRDRLDGEATVSEQDHFFESGRLTEFLYRYKTRKL